MDRRPEKSGFGRKLLQKISLIMVPKARTGNPYNLMHGRLRGWGE